MRHGIFAEHFSLVVSVRYRLCNHFHTIRRHSQKLQVVSRSFVEERIALLDIGPLATQIVVRQENAVG